MEEIDPLVSALIRLCDAQGGYKNVADIAKISPANLWQIISGIKLPSGNPRGVGPRLREKILAAYPDWLITFSDAAARASEQYTSDLITKNMEDWRKKASPRSLAVIDTLLVAIQQERFTEEDWLLYQQLNQRLLQRRP